MKYLRMHYVSCMLFLVGTSVACSGPVARAGSGAVSEQARTLTEMVENYAVSQGITPRLPLRDYLTYKIGNPRLDELPRRIASEFDASILRRILVYPQQRAEGDFWQERYLYEKAATYAAMGLGAIDTQQSREALLEALGGSSSLTAIMIMNSLSYMADQKVVDAIIQYSGQHRPPRPDPVRVGSFALDALVICAAYAPESQGKIVGFVEKRALRAKTADAKAGAVMVLARLGELDRAAAAAYLMWKDPDEETAAEGWGELGYLGIGVELRRRMEEELKRKEPSLSNVQRALEEFPALRERIKYRSWREDAAGSYAGRLRDLADRYPEHDEAERQKSVEEMMALIREIVRLGPVEQSIRQLQSLAEDPWLQKHLPEKVLSAAQDAVEALRSRVTAEPTTG